MTTMFLPHVYQRWERSTGVAARTMMPTLAEAMAVLDAEVERVGKPPLKWRQEFGGAVADRGDLRYEVAPIEVHLPATGAEAAVERVLALLDETERVAHENQHLARLGTRKVRAVVMGEGAGG